MLKRFVIIISICLLSGCGMRDTSLGAPPEHNVREDVYPIPTPDPSPDPTLPPATSSSAPTPSPSPSPSPSPEASPSPTTKESSDSSDFDPEEFKKIKAELLPQHPEVSDVGLVGSLMFQLNKQIGSTDFVGSLKNLKQAKGIYRIICVRVMNNYKKPVTLDYDSFSLVGSDGSTYVPDPEAAIYDKLDQSFIYDPINPGIEAGGYLIFDMPSDVKFRNVKLKVEYDGKSTELEFKDPSK